MSRGYSKSIGLDPAVYRIEEPRLVDGHYEAAVRLADPGFPPCRECGGGSVAHDSRIVDVHHEPHRSRPLVLKLVAVRRRCRRCGKTFYLDQPLLSGITPHVSGLCAEFIARRISEGATVARIEGECGTPKGMVGKVEAGLELPKHRLPVHVCIDEVRGFKKTAAASGRPHMCSCLYDAERKTLVDMAAGDKPDVVRPFIESFSRVERNAVESVSCDLNGSYIKMARELFPNAGIYADKFHVAKLVTGAVEEARKDLRRELDAAKKAAEAELELAKAARSKARAGGRKAANPGAIAAAESAVESAEAALKEAAARLTALDGACKPMLKRHAEAGRRERAKIRAAFELEGTRDIRRAYLVLQMFYSWSDADYGSRAEMAESLWGWAERARLATVPHVTRAVKTIMRKDHVELVLNGYEHGRTNAVAEAMNRRIKDIIRDARGFNGFEALRRRCLLVLGHERTPNKPIPIFKRKKKEKGGDAA